jgi:hypothetical protein
VTNGPEVDLGGYVKAFEWVETTIDLPRRYDYIVRVRLDMVGDRYELKRFTVEQRPGGPPLTDEGMRTLPTAEIVRAAMVAGYHPPSPASTRALHDDGAKVLARGIDDDAALTAVAMVHTMAALKGGAPVDSVAAWLGCSHSTATRWVAAARRQGHLPPESGGPQAVDIA